MAEGGVVCGWQGATNGDWGEAWLVRCCLWGCGIAWLIEG